MVNGWRYYYHALIPTSAPHLDVDTSAFMSREFWQGWEGHPLFARWTSEFDCGYETNWWYVIKDTPFKIDELKAKRRYEITKGQKNFDVKVINPEEYKDEIYRVTVSAFTSWPEKYRPVIVEQDYKNELINTDMQVYFAAFDKDTDELSGYAIMNKDDNCVLFNLLRVNPSQEKRGINASIVSAILDYYNNYFTDGFYILDGARSIRHETHFQDYLEKYFGFRKAYCKLNIRYKGLFGVVVKLIFPFRRIIKTDSSLGSKVSGVLYMEELRKQQRK